VVEVGAGNGVGAAGCWLLVVGAVVEMVWQGVTGECGEFPAKNTKSRHNA
jgi:hypothetical protein